MGLFFVLSCLVFCGFAALRVESQYVFDLYKNQPALQAVEVMRILKDAVPGESYPALTHIPETNFSCDQMQFPGFYSDTDETARCQVFHRCDLNGLQTNYLCPNTTVFSQILLTCDYFFNVDCNSEVKYRNFANSRLYQAGAVLFDTPPTNYTPNLNPLITGSKAILPFDTTTVKPISTAKPTTKAESLKILSSKLIAKPRSDEVPSYQFRDVPPFPSVIVTSRKTAPQQNASDSALMGQSNSTNPSTAGKETTDMAGAGVIIVADEKSGATTAMSRNLTSATPLPVTTAIASSTPKNPAMTNGSLRNISSSSKESTPQTLAPLKPGNIITTTSNSSTVSTVTPKIASLSSIVANTSAKTTLETMSTRLPSPNTVAISTTATVKNGPDSSGNSSPSRAPATQKTASTNAVTPIQGASSSTPGSGPIIPPSTVGNLSSSRGSMQAPVPSSPENSTTVMVVRL